MCRNVSISANNKFYSLPLLFDMPLITHNQEEKCTFLISLKLILLSYFCRRTKEIAIPTGARETILLCGSFFFSLVCLCLSVSQGVGQCFCSLIFLDATLRSGIGNGYGNKFLRFCFSNKA